MKVIHVYVHREHAANGEGSGCIGSGFGSGESQMACWREREGTGVGTGRRGQARSTATSQGKQRAAPATSCETQFGTCNEQQEVEERGRVGRVGRSQVGKGTSRRGGSAEVG